MDALKMKERDRRWSNIRAELEKNGLDGLLVVTDGELDVKAQAAGAEKLKAGNTGGDVMRAINEALKGSKYTGAIRGSGHAVGLDIIERPYVSLDDETVLKPGMIVAIHPVLAPRPGFFEACADMFVITEKRPRKLSRITPELKVVGR